MMLVKAFVRQKYVYLLHPMVSLITIIDENTYDNNNNNNENNKDINIQSITSKLDH